MFVYGATGAGKTHTMLGNENHKGIMYLTMVDLYKHMDACQDTLNIELGISYLEVSNNNGRLDEVKKDGPPSLLFGYLGNKKSHQIL